MTYVKNAVALAGIASAVHIATNLIASVYPHLKVDVFTTFAGRFVG